MKKINISYKFLTLYIFDTFWCNKVKEVKLYSYIVPKNSIFINFSYIQKEGSFSVKKTNIFLKLECINTVATWSTWNVI